MTNPYDTCWEPNIFDRDYVDSHYVFNYKTSIFRVGLTNYANTLTCEISILSKHYDYDAPTWSLVYYKNPTGNWNQFSCEAFLPYVLLHLCGIWLDSNIDMPVSEFLSKTLTIK